MIVPMKKIAVLAQQKDSFSTVEGLRKLGVVHVEHVEAPQSEVLGKLRDAIALIDSALSILSQDKFVKAAGKIQQETPGDWKFCARHIVDLNKRLDQLEEYSRQLKKRIAEWERWGDFDPEAIRNLNKRNIFFRLYQIPQKDMDKISDDAVVKVIFKASGLAHCMVISRQEIGLPFKEIALPKLGLEKMRGRLYEDGRMMEIIQDDICKYMSYRQSLNERKKELQKELEFNEALSGMGKEGVFTYLTGFVPINEVGTLKEQARRERWALMIREPSEEEAVPTLLKNPRLITLIKPMLNLLGILPGYRELDVSLSFLIFFSIFFGILIGDAGYGLSYFLITLWFQKKKGASLKNNNIFLLLYLLSSCAIIWGVLSGTFFGQSWLIKLGINPLFPRLNDPVFMQTLCFFLGALH
ncbi:MAG: hypothetical protein ABIA66_02655, partial [Candidatus Omnitrophota bacterium]